MSGEFRIGGWRPSPATLIASVLVVAGFALTALDWGFVAIAAVGMFLPGILREVGVLHDKDEFEMEAARRAGYHAYLAGGLFTFLLVAWFRSAHPSLAHPGALVEDVLIVMWFTWLLSSLFSYWGAHRTAARILWIFGILWLVFNLLAGGGDWTGTLMQSLLALPFVAAALAARRWPKATGVFLLAVSVFFFWFFGLADAFRGDPTGKGRIQVLILFLGPLLASGVALLSRMQPEEREERG